MNPPSREVLPAPLSRSWYSDSFAAFLATSPERVFAHLAGNPEFDLITSQKAAWLEQLRVLRDALAGMNGVLHLEFSIPRMGRRVDAVLLIGPVVFVLEFKVGESAFPRDAIDQVWDYALDLKNFHEGSHSAAIVPVLVATEACHPPPLALIPHADQVHRPVLTNPASLRVVVEEAVRTIAGATVDARAWARASYKPTPTIIEAARALYANHSVEAIARHDADATNLRLTAHRIEEIVARARVSGSKVLCFVTGVPGAGKTLVGLNAATGRREGSDEDHAVFLSGNGPLVAVLREALTRDDYARRRQAGQRITKKAVADPVKAFIQNIHHFRDEALIDTSPPDDRVVIFDEAQRAWNARQASSFMRRRKNVPNFNASEPAFLIEYMDRHRDWAVIICLVGGGQEIHTGEAGIGAWIEAANTAFRHWHLHISPRLTDTEYEAGRPLALLQGRPNVFFDEDLHLAVSMRSFRAEHVSSFIKAVLDCDVPGARSHLDSLGNRYPLVLTRDLQVAKDWIRGQARGNERYGLVASSKAQRLKPHAIDVRVDVDPVHWFLNDREDTRSSFYLEDAATEFQVQGLELDWTCVTWDGDLRFSGDGWSYHDFRGDDWTRVNKAENRAYLKNAYRVLLTRARQGMVLFVPRGDAGDRTRTPAYYDGTFSYLKEIGLVEIG